MTQEGESRFVQALMDFQPSIAILTDGIEILFANRAFLEFFDSPSLPDFKTRHRCICECFIDRPGYLPSAHGAWRSQLDENNAKGIESHALIAKDGGEHIFRVRMRVLPAKEQMIVASFEDVTLYEAQNKALEAANRNLELRIQERTWELIEYNEELERQKELLEGAQRIARMGNWNYESTIRQFDASKMLLGIFGYEAPVRFRVLMRHLFKKDRRKLFNFLKQARAGKEGDSIELRILDTRKNQKTVRFYATAFLDDHGHVYRFSGVCQDISQAIELESQAYYDQLTKAYNRHKMIELLEREVGSLQSRERPVALIMFDIDHFKRINDTFGHPAGDSVLTELSGRVGALLEDEAIFARWGGEEFMIALPGSGLLEAADQAQRLLEAIGSTPFAQIGTVTCSFGAIEYRDGEALHEGIKRCDDALYAAKRGGRNRVIADL